MALVRLVTSGINLRHSGVNLHCGSFLQSRPPKTQSSDAENGGGNDAFWEYSELIYQRAKSNGSAFSLKNLQPLRFCLAIATRPA